MHDDLLRRLGLAAFAGSSGALVSLNPATAEPLGSVGTATRRQYDAAVVAAEEAFLRWRLVPPPKRGEIVRQIGEALRRQKHDLGLLVTLETGKILAEGEGEVQEMIDMCDFAVGLSRQLYGLTMASERPQHRMFEQWHPLGPVGVLTAFNFPVAVWAWNAMLAAVCGDTVVWKPSPHTPLCALAVAPDRRARDETGRLRRGFSRSLITPGAEAGHWMADDRAASLGFRDRKLCDGPRGRLRASGRRLGRTLLELGGNNGVIVTESADLQAGPARGRLCRPGHDGPALHDPAATVRARIDCRAFSRRARRRLSQRADRQPVGRRRADGSADQRGGGGPHDGRTRRRPATKGARSSAAASAWPARATSSSRPSFAPGPRCPSSQKRRSPPSCT